MPVHPADLGENSLFYDSVDAVVWLSGNADDLDRGGAHRREALDEFVRGGGKLIVCQPADRQKIEALSPLLPIEAKDAAGNWAISFTDKPSFVDQSSGRKDAPPVDALPALALPEYNPQYKPTWHLIKGPIRFAIAKAKNDAVIDDWQDWGAGGRTPFIVRGSHGLGCVTWVAQDLGDVGLTGPLSDNWPHIWDRVIGWRNDTQTLSDLPNADALSKAKDAAQNTDGLVDFSEWMLQGTDYTAKAAAYIVLAVVFFLLYWIASGPGTYFFLAGKKRKELNWFIFGAWAFVGTLVTVLVVRLVLRGDAEVRHLSIVRNVAGQPTYVYSRVGLVYSARWGPDDCVGGYITRCHQLSWAFTNSSKVFYQHRLSGGAGIFDSHSR